MNSTQAEPAMQALGELALTRSGDKGNHANLGVLADSQRVYEHLVHHLTAERVHAFFAGWGATHVERFLMPNVWALNFILYNVLAGGASRSLRIDTQGKLLGVAAAELRLPALLSPSTSSTPQEPGA